MKAILKQFMYGSLGVLTRVKTTRFSDMYNSFGYLLKSESEYNSNPQLPTFKDRLDLHEHLSSNFIAPEEKIIFLEFGVMKGQTFAIWVKNNKSDKSGFTGFDTFQGLPEDWGNIKKGSYSAKGKLPDIRDPRVNFCVGLIQDTLPGFIKNLSKGTKKVIHIDVDLYNATLITLIHVQPFLEKGDIIIFDEFFSLTKAAHEFRAFLDFLSLYKLEYKPLFKSRNGHYVIEIL